MPEFMLVPLIIAIWWFILKHLLIRHFIFIPFWESQMLTYITAMLDLENILMMYRQDAKTMLLKLWLFLLLCQK